MIDLKEIVNYNLEIMRIYTELKIKEEKLEKIEKYVRENENIKGEIFFNLIDIIEEDE